MSDWREALAPTPECIAIERLGEELNESERTHLETCARCHAELALFRELDREERSPEGEWIANELRRRGGEAIAPVPFPHRRAEARRSTWRVLYAVAAALAITIGAGWWMQTREPSIDGPLDDPGTYRGARLEVLAPAGELAQAPNELRWTAVPNASRYRFRILEVDGTVVWSGETTETHVALPPAVVAQFAPGKSLRWEVQAFRGTGMLASSETQSVRVSVAPRRMNP